MLGEQRDSTQLNRRLAVTVMILGVVVLLTGGATAYLWWQRPAAKAAGPGGQVALVAGDLLDNLDLWLADPAGKNRQRLTSTPENEVYPTWSPDGSKLAFVRLVELDQSGLQREWGENEGLYWLRFEGEQPVEEQLLLASEGGIGVPSWSPDGRYLAFAAPVDTTDPDLLESQLALIDAATKKRTITRIPVGYNGATAGQVSWSPDGKTLALQGLFRPNKGSQPRPAAYVCPLDSQELRMVAQEVGAVAWSPTGLLLACQSVGQAGGLRLIQPDGAELRTLLPDNYVLAFAWSPDGTTLAMARAASERNGELVLYQLADDSTTVIPLEEGRFPAYLTWSADGRYLSYTASSQSASEVELAFTVEIMDVRVGMVMPFAHQKPIELMASWQPASAE